MIRVGRRTVKRIIRGNAFGMIATGAVAGLMFLTGSGFGVRGPTGPLYMLTLPVILIFEAFPANARHASRTTSGSLALPGLLYILVLGVFLGLIYLGIRRLFGHPA